MSPLPASLVSAARSGAIRGNHLAVFVELHELLDDAEFRPVKCLSVALALHLDPSLVYRAIEALVTAGFVQQGPRAGLVRTFRLMARSERAA